MSNQNWSISVWQGAGYYAPYNYYNGDYTLYYFCGTDRQEAEEYARVAELGTPAYFESNENEKTPHPSPQA